MNKGHENTKDLVIWVVFSNVVYQLSVVLWDLKNIPVLLLSVLQEWIHFPLSGNPDKSSREDFTGSDQA